jgi:tetratricopeptide (TPR) repeat protein
MSNEGRRWPIIAIATVLLNLLIFLESRQNFERAVADYERLAAAYPAQKESLLALLSAGICLRKLNRPADTLRNYKAAQASTIPHLDWEANISMGIQAAESVQPSATSTLKWRSANR